MKEKKEESKKCPFFDVCGAYIIREKRQDQESFEILIRKKMVINLTKWSEQVCFGDFQKCVHYQDRIEINAFITEEGKKVKLYPK